MDQRAFSKLTYGLYVAGVKDPAGRFCGSLVDAVAQVAMGSRPYVALGSMNKNYTTEVLLQTGLFTLSVLPADAEPFVLADFGFQSGRNIDKWANVTFEVYNDLPVLKSSVARLLCRIDSMRIFETHHLFVAEIIEADHIGGEPLIYADYFTRLKGPVAEAFKIYKQTGKPPASAQDGPAGSVPEAPQKREKWVCSVCGYVYDGDVPFEELPDTYTCPLCGQPKSVFVKE